MAGYRTQFIKAFRTLSATLPLPWLMALSRQRLVLPVYHLVSDDAVDHVRHLYPVKTVKAFQEDLEFLLKHYQAIGYNDLAKAIFENKPFKKPAFLLTFDDGLREFHDVIAPILLQKGIPAICFLNSDFVDNKGLFYRYKASLLMDALGKDEALLRSDSVQNWLNGQSDYRKVLLAIPYHKQNELDALAQLLGIDFQQYLTRQQPYLTSAQILSLKNQGFHFGAHSCDHPEYQYLDLQEQLRQTRDSVGRICEQFSLPYRTFAFPFTDYGVSKDFFDTVYEHEKMLELSFGCAGLKQETYPRHLQRIPLEMGDWSAKEILHSEYFYFLLKALLGKNRILRK